MFEDNRGYTKRLLGEKNVWTYLILYSESCDQASSAPEQFPLMWMTSHLFPNLQACSTFSVPPPPQHGSRTSCSPESAFLLALTCAFSCDISHVSYCDFCFTLFCVFVFSHQLDCEEKQHNQCNMFFVVFMILTFTLHTSAIIYSNLHKYSVWCT